MRTKFTIPALLAASLAVSGCVASDVERAAVGAVAVGAGTYVLGGSLVTGAAIGAAAGALCDDVDLCPDF